MWKMVWFNNSGGRGTRPYFTNVPDAELGLRPMSLVLAVTGIPVLVIFIAFFASLLVTNNQRRQYTLEAQLRKIHARIRMCAEAIAFYGGEQEASSILRQKLDDCIKNMERYAFCKVTLDFLVTSLLRLGYVMGWIAAEIAEPEGRNSVSDILYIVLAVECLMTRAAYICNQIIDLAHATAGSVRVIELYQELERLLEKDRIRKQGGLEEEGFMNEDNQIVFQHVRLFSPQGDPLPLPRVSFRLEPGESLLVCGPAGCGKSSLLRLLGGLWPFYRPPQRQDILEDQKILVARPPSTAIFCLTQRPYLHSGTLREQIAYPIWDQGLIEDLTDDILEALLLECNLGPLTTTRRGDWDKLGICWENVLSLGEQQRLAFARLLWHHDWQLEKGLISVKGRGTAPSFFALLDNPSKV